jgi:hypothetical protein
MGTTDFFKSAVDSLGKVTDILNLGRLIFYTAAGFCAVLPAAMSLRLLAHDPPLPVYWTQFVADLRSCARHGEVWVVALIFGFIIANLAYSIVISRFTSPPRHEPQKDSYPYSYARLFSGGVRSKDGTKSDYAAWLVSEYYRYVEIVVFIPYGILLSLPLYSFYSFVYLVRTAWQHEALVLNAGHLAFAMWTLGSVFAWTVLWPDYWLPRVAEPVYHVWVRARRSAIEGLQEFVTDPKASPDTGGTQPSPSKQ